MNTTVVLLDLLDEYNI